MKTFTPHVADVERKWYLIDATGCVLGRLAAQVAHILRGKEKPIYSPHIDTGDHVVIINAKNILFTGRKKENKIYYHYTGYPGGLKQVKLKTLLEEKPEKPLMLAIKGMLPHNKLGRAMLKKVRIYAGSEHPHKAQELQSLKGSRVQEVKRSRGRGE
jgi:large subunit ribosomal protein L13